MSDNLGTARLSLGLDTTEWEATLRRAKNAYGDMSQAAQQQAQQLSHVEAKKNATLMRNINALGLTRAEQLKLLAVERTSGELQKEMLALIDRRVAALNRETNAVNANVNAKNKYGLTDKQQVAAMRQVPAQITDIFVSLAGGQNPMMVMIQQGGQLKDVFGGIAPAAKALSGAILGLLNPITLTAAAVGMLGAAWIAGEKDQRKFAQAVELTNGYMDVSAGEMQNIATRMTNSSTSFGAAADALAKVATTGKFTASQLSLVSSAAVDMERLVGQSIDTTIGEFEKIKQKPVEAIMELNSKYHFLTESTYLQIDALVKQGRESEAAGVAMRAYAGHVDDALAQVESRLTSVETFWRSVKSAALEAWAAMKSAISASSQAEQIRALERQRDAIELGTGGTGPMDRLGNWLLNDRGKKEKVSRIEAQLRELYKSEADAEKRSRQQQADDLATSFANDTRQYETRQQKRVTERAAVSQRAAKAIAAAEASGAADTVARIKRIRENEAAQLAGIDQKYKESKKAGGRSGARQARQLANAEAKNDLQEIKDAYALQRAEIENNNKLLTAQYQARFITEDEYRKKSRDNSESLFKAEEASITQQIATLKARNATGVDSVRVQGQLQQLETSLLKLRADHAVQVQILNINEQKLLEDRKRANEEYQRAIEDQVKSVYRNNQAQVDALMLSRREFDYKQRMVDITERETAALRKLRDERDLGNLDPASFASRSIMVAAGAQQERDAVVSSYMDMAAAQQDWLAGAKNGLKDWIDANADANTQVRNLTMQTIDSLVDGFTEVATTGKLQWRDLLASILTDITKFMMKQAVLEFLKAFTNEGSGSSSGGGFWSNLLGAAVKVFANANGGVYNSPGLSAYSGQVVNKPTMFAFAKGAGLMGEAGPEAIMPLQRGPSGKLGVQMYGGGGLGNVTISITNVMDGQGGVQTKSSANGDASQLLNQFAKRQSEVAREELQRAVMPNGMLWKLGVRA